MGSNLSDWEQQLASLRGVTASTGIVHDAQIFQLKMYGATAFLHVGKGNWEAQVDIDTKTIVYKLKFKGKHPKELPALVAAIDRSIHWLLGDDWAVNIKQNKKIIYRGARILRDVDDNRKKALQQN